jgi:hypothetical protein
MNMGAGLIGAAIAVYAIVVSILADRWMTFEEQLTAITRKMTKDLQGIGPEDYDKAVTVVKQAEARWGDIIRVRHDFSPKSVVILPCALFVGGILFAAIGMVNSSCSTSWLYLTFSVVFLMAGVWNPIRALFDIHKVATGWIPTTPPDKFVSKPIIVPPYEAPQGVGPFPTVLAQIQQRNFVLPRVGFSLSNFNKFPLKARVKATVKLGARKLGTVPPDPHGYYSGKAVWNLNAETAIFGNFAVHSECVSSSEPLRIQVEVTITDLQSREHKLLPICYTYVRESNSWYLEPTGIDGLTRNSGNQ